jgi:hypothetical protein
VSASSATSPSRAPSSRSASSSAPNALTVPELRDRVGEHWDAGEHHPARLAGLRRVGET